MYAHPNFSPSVFPFTARSPIHLANITFPHSNGTTLQDEIQCYSIPYGLVGFLSHLLSYYTLAVTAFGRKPLRPWKPLTRKNRILSVIQVVGTIALAAYTIYACHDRWQFVLIGVWKLLWNAEKGAWQIGTSWRVSEQQAIESQTGLYELNDIRLAALSGSVDKKGHNFLLYLVNLYNMAAIIGLVGVASLVKLAAHEVPHVLTITEVFGAVVGAVILLAIFGAFIGEAGALFTLPIMAIAVLFALYSDWIIGAIANNLIGNPQSNKVFYWAYFVFKHLALLML